MGGEATVLVQRRLPEPQRRCTHTHTPTLPYPNTHGARPSTRGTERTPAEGGSTPCRYSYVTHVASSRRLGVLP